MNRRTFLKLTSISAITPNLLALNTKPTVSTEWVNYQIAIPQEGTYFVDKWEVINLRTGEIRNRHIYIEQMIKHCQKWKTNTSPIVIRKIEDYTVELGSVPGRTNVYLFAHYRGEFREPLINESFGLRHNFQTESTRYKSCWKPLFLTKNTPPNKQHLGQYLLLFDPYTKQAWIHHYYGRPVADNYYWTTWDSEDINV